MKTLTFNKTRIGLLVLGLVIAIFAFTVMLVKADTAPVVTTAIHNGSHSSITSASIGTGVHANVGVASSTGPVATGTVDFTLYPNTTCAGTASTTQTAVALSGGVAESATTTVPSTGLSYKVHYNGLTDVYPPTDGICMPVSAIGSAVGVTTTLSTSTSVLAGSSVWDSAVLSGATSNATGTVAYNAYTNNTCNAGSMDAGTKTVASGVVPNSNSLQFNSAGTFYFQAVYSGDQNNSAATSSCLSEVLTVVATSTPPTPGSGSIAGMVYYDLDGDGVKDSGETTGLSGWTINLYNGNGWSHNGTVSPIQTMVSNGSGNYSFSNLSDGTYSIEEINKVGWIQTTGDYNNVVIASGAHLTDKDFGDATTTATSTVNRHDNGKHLGWFRGLGNQFKNFVKHMNKQLEGKHNNGKNDDNENDD